MYNDVKVGPLTFHLYGFFIAVGFFAALLLCSYVAKKRKLSDDIVWGIYLCAIIGGFIGCRLLFYITELPNIIDDPSILWDFNNGYVVYGGIIGGIVASMIYCHVKRVVFLDYFDVVAPAISLAQFFGRIGCLCAGCCYGKPTDAWYGITFKHSEYAPNGIKLVPTQIISSLGDLCIFAILMVYSAKRPKRGRVAAMYIILYGLGRFAVEFLRYDYRGNLGILSTSQFISIVMVLIGIVMFWMADRFTDKAEANDVEETLESVEPSEE